MTSPRIWFITGANRGIGLEIARAALAAGDHVVATARRKQSVIDALGERDDVLARALDVTDKQQVGHAARIVLKVFPVRNLREHREKMFLFIQLEVRMDGQHVRALKDAGYFTFV